MASPRKTTIEECTAPASNGSVLPDRRMKLRQEIIVRLHKQGKSLLEIANLIFGLGDAPEDTPNRAISSKDHYDGKRKAIFRAIVEAIDNA